VNVDEFAASSVVEVGRYFVAAAVLPYAAVSVGGRHSAGNAGSSLYESV